MKYSLLSHLTQNLHNQTVSHWNDENFHLRHAFIRNYLASIPSVFYQEKRSSFNFRVKRLRIFHNRTCDIWMLMIQRIFKQFFLVACFLIPFSNEEKYLFSQEKILLFGFAAGKDYFTRMYIYDRGLVSLNSSHDSRKWTFLCLSDSLFRFTCGGELLKVVWIVKSINL